MAGVGTGSFNATSFSAMPTRRSRFMSAAFERRRGMDKVEGLARHTDEITDLIAKMGARQLQIFTAIKIARIEWLLERLPCWIPEDERKEMGRCAGL